MTFLLDTNVVSELVRSAPEPRVVDWVDRQSNAALYLSVLTLGEIRAGVEKLSLGAKRESLTAWLEVDLPGWFDGRLLGVDARVADLWGALTGRSAAQGRVLSAVDGLIAATALIHGLTLVTRNVRDFDGLEGLVVLNPWEA